MTEILTLSGHGRSYRMYDPGSHIGGIIRRSQGPYEPRLLEDIYQRCHRGGTAVDVGAHVGNHALWMAAVCGMTVHAFEPMKANTDRLKRNAGLNPRARIIVRPVALGARVGRASTAASAQDVDWGRASLDSSGGPIKVRTLDAFKLQDVRVIKVDVEGMEPQVITGAADTIARCRPLVYAEAPDEDARGAIDEILTLMGYTLTRRKGLASTPVGRWEPA